MTGPTRTFDPFGNDGAMHAADLKAAADSAEQTSTLPTASVTAASASAATAAANHTAAAFISPAPPKSGSGQPRHSSIFEIGGEPFCDAAAAPSARLGRTIGLTNGSALSSTTSPVGLHPLGSIMGSTHSLFDSAYTAQSQLPPNARGATSSTHMLQPSAHRLSQSRFGGALGDSGMHPPAGLARNDNEPMGAQSTVDMSNGLLDTIKSQQASPNNAGQAGINDFFVKSLPVSRRNSREFQNLWQELEGFSIKDSPVHMQNYDGHSIAARNSSGAFRNEPAAGAMMGSGLLGTSPKLPQGLLDEDVLSVRPKQAAANGLHRAQGSGLLRIGSSTDFSHAQPAYQAYAYDAHPQQQPPMQPPRQTLNNTDGAHAEAAQNSRRFDAGGRNASLIRNASTPVLNTKQYQGMQTMDDPSGHLHTVPSASALADSSMMLYGQQYQTYPATANEMTYDAAGNRLSQNVAFPYGANASALAASRNQSFINNAPGSGTVTPAGNGYGIHSSFAPAPGIYGVGQQHVQHSGPHTPLQHSHYASSHIHVHTQPQGQASGNAHAKHPTQRHSQQPPAASSAQPGSGPPQQQQPAAHHNPKHAHAKANRKGETESNRFANVQLEELEGTLFEVCKDQHGCRFLQKKLEDGQENHVSMIFKEVLPHFSSLMTDPFGNYLCQKLLEHCSESQRTQIVASVAPDLVNVSLNMHGTRAVQKMIESLSKQEQIDTIIDALRECVVMLIRDLNGNHVIQKCLSRLNGKNNQFIYDSVAASCTDVATHRHGCCVFQRCIDYATGTQKMQLVEVIISKALALVQDPFGNYVVQYILDLNVPDYSEPLITKFFGHICGLSVQKFSSNVMEKCIRLASPYTRKHLVAPLMQRDKLEMLMRDSYGNYVVQTALDFADQHQRLEIIEAILPLLPLIRNTPYGKRIYSKLQRDGFISAVPSAAGSRHASPTLGPTHGAHPNAAISAMSMYPHIPAAMTPLAAGSMGLPAAAAGAALSRAVSPTANGVNPQLSQPRGFAQGTVNSAFQQQPTQHAGGMYYYSMAPMDASGQPQVRPAVSMMAPVHPSAVPSSGSIVYDQASIATHPALSTSPNAAGSSRAHISSPAYYGSR
ncbi:hypothetical protein GGH96_002021 [Coemansia sp. RSA 1972]|nr:hypothetical protein GGH96_002021 [Coemansia sp. RSA 1972]